jgi:predicted membrane-bound spermidine synthase
VNSLERSTVRVAVFIAGATLMAAEVAAFRVIGKSFGSALRETTAVIAVFLAAMSAGYWAGGRAGDRWPRTTTLVEVLLLAAASLLAVPWLDASLVQGVVAATLRVSLHAFIATALLFAMPTALLASVSPIAIRLFTSGETSSGSTAGSISAISTAGSIVGSLATAFFLLDWLRSIVGTILFLAAVTAATALLLALSALPTLSEIRRYSAGGVLAIAIAGVAASALVQSTKIEASLFRDAPGWKTLFTGDSPYHHVVVRERRGAYRTLSFGIGLQSSMLVADPSGPGLPYVDSFPLGVLIRPETKRVLLIGLGGGTAVRQFLATFPDVRIDAVEVDPMVVDVAKRFFALPEDPRLRIHIRDGRTFLRDAREKWDLIIVDAYTTNRYGATIPPHLVTREFFQEAKAHLSDTGIFHFHCAFGNAPILPALQKTMATVFASTITTRGEILGSPSSFLISPRANQLPAARFPTLRAYVEALRPVPAEAAAAPLLTDDYAPIDSLLRDNAAP